MAGAVHTDADIAAGLRVDRLSPADLVALWRGVPRRVTAGLETIEDDDAEGRAEAEAVVVEINDRLADLVELTQGAGYPIDTELDDLTPAALPSDEELTTLWFAGLELARWTSGISSTGWKESPELLDRQQRAAAEISALVRRIGSGR